MLFPFSVAQGSGHSISSTEQEVVGHSLGARHTCVLDVQTPASSPEQFSMTVGSLRHSQELDETTSS